MSYDYNPNKANPDYCKESVPDGGGSVGFHQCKRKPVKDGYCKVHHPDAVAERNRKAAKRYEETSPWFKLKRMAEERNALAERVKELEALLGIKTVRRIKR